MRNQNNGTYSLAHTRWKCQYHIVFTPKYRRKIIYGALRAEIGKILIVFPLYPLAAYTQTLSLFYTHQSHPFWIPPVLVFVCG